MNRGTFKLMADLKLKTKVIKLREKGKTYSEIKKELNIIVPKSTLSHWCKNVKLPKWYALKIEKLSRKNIGYAQKVAQASNERKREIFLKSLELEAKKVIKHLDQNSFKIILAVLYLGEGAKWKGHSGLMLGSSDQNIIILYLKLLNKCYNIKPQELKCRISYRADQNIKELEKHWSKITEIPLENFYKTKPDPRTIGKKTLKKDYKGVCVLTCKGSSIQLELEQIIHILIKHLLGL